MVRKEDLVALASFRRALRKYIRFVEDSARAAHITPQQHQVLLAIGGTEDRDWLTVSELADALQLPHHAVVGLVDRCQSAGLVSRSSSPDDRRVVRVGLSERGEQILYQLTARNLAEFKRYVGGLSSDVGTLSRGYAESEP